MIQCESCRRHHLQTETTCPFCKTAVNPAIWAMNLLGGMVTTVVLAACYGTGDIFLDKYTTYTGDTGFTDWPWTDTTTDTTPTPTGETGTSSGDTGTDTGTDDTGVDDTGTDDTGTDDTGTDDTGTDDTGTDDTGTDDTGTDDTGTSDTGDPVWVDDDGDCYPARWDCDDDDPTIHPDFPEQCTDQIDNDCDGLVDDADPEC
jgi:hypothetical protein